MAWDLIIEGVLRPGLNDGNNPNLPHFHVTDLGRDRIRHDGGHPTPYDPDGYLRKLKETIPNVDSVILTYLEEASRTFRINCLLSACVTLGCAAEKAMLLLVSAYADALPEPRATNFRQQTEGKLIKRQMDEFKKYLEGHLKGQLPGDLKEGLDTTMLGIFELIRSYRNEAGHPSGANLDRALVYANLVLFPQYAKKTYALIDWLGAHKPLS